MAKIKISGPYTPTYKKSRKARKGYSCTAITNFIRQAGRPHQILPRRTNKVPLLKIWRKQDKEIFRTRSSQANDYEEEDEESDIEADDEEDVEHRDKDCDDNGDTHDMEMDSDEELQGTNVPGIAEEENKKVVDAEERILSNPTEPILELVDRGNECSEAISGKESALAVSDTAYRKVATVPEVPETDVFRPKKSDMLGNLDSWEVIVKGRSRIKADTLFELWKSAHVARRKHQASQEEPQLMPTSIEQDSGHDDTVPNNPEKKVNISHVAQVFETPKRQKRKSIDGEQNGPSKRSRINASTATRAQSKDLPAELQDSNVEVDGHMNGAEISTPTEALPIPATAVMETASRIAGSEYNAIVETTATSHAMSSEKIDFARSKGKNIGPGHRLSTARHQVTREEMQDGMQSRDLIDERRTEESSRGTCTDKLDDECAVPTVDVKKIMEEFGARCNGEIAEKIAKNRKKRPYAAPGAYLDPIVAALYPAIHHVYMEVYSETEVEEAETPIGELGSDELLKRQKKSRQRKGEPEPELWNGSKDLQRHRWYNNISGIQKRRQRIADAAAKAAEKT